MVSYSLNPLTDTAVGQAWRVASAILYVTHSFDRDERKRESEKWEGEKKRKRENKKNKEKEKKI